jgi:two-component system OmpR family sensor kinase
MKIRIHDSVRVPLTLWYVSILALVLIAFSIVVYTLLSRSLYERVDEGLRSVLGVATVSIMHDTEEGQTSEGAAQSTVAELYNSQQTLAIFDGSGRLLAKNDPDDEFRPSLPALDLMLDGQAYLYTETEQDGDDNHRVAVQQVAIPPQSTPYIIFASQPLEPIEEELESLRNILYSVGPVALVIAGLGGWFLARKSLAPVVEMSERARWMGAANLDQRLPVANPRDELGQLAVTFNELLARVNAAFDQQRKFMADASHELRTPLSVMHVTADVTLDRPHRDESEYREAIRMMYEQTQQLTRIVEDMFILARADSGRFPLRKSKFYLDELVEETARAAGILASGKEVTIEVVRSSESPVYSDEDLLRRMILNLLDNAIKYTPPKGTVRVSLTQYQQSYYIEVSDTGTGIPEDAQSHIFSRFYRVDKARSRADGAGAGLGLAIALWIAEAHGGSLRLTRSDSGGSTFVAALPIAASN